MGTNFGRWEIFEVHWGSASDKTKNHSNKGRHGEDGAQRKDCKSSRFKGAVVVGKDSHDKEQSTGDKVTSQQSKGDRVIGLIQHV